MIKETIIAEVKAGNIMPYIIADKVQDAASIEQISVDCRYTIKVAFKELHRV